MSFCSAATIGDAGVGVGVRLLSLMMFPLLLALPSTVRRLESSPGEVVVRAVRGLN